jgi:hypothetical protein
LLCTLKTPFKDERMLHDSEDDFLPWSNEGVKDTLEAAFKETSNAWDVKNDN